MKATLNPQSTSSNEVYTYIAIPVDALQQSLDQGGGHSLTVAQNVILKALPDGNISQQIQPITVPENFVFRTVSKDQKKNSSGNQVGVNLIVDTSSKLGENEKQTTSTRPTVIEQNNTQSSGGVTRKSVISKSEVSKPEKEVRYLKCKHLPPVTCSKNKKQQTGSFKCTICGEILGKMILYRKHMEMHRNTKKYRCEQCTASYNVEDNLKLHMAMHSKSGPICPICNRKFQRLASLKAHIIIHQVDETFTCIECLAEYEKEDDLNKHMESHKKKVECKNPDLPLTCSFCSHTFHDLGQYKEHISFHIKIKRLMMNTKKHKRQVNSNREYQYKCDICKKTFAKYCLLERHMRIHSGEKPFACHLCERAFNQKGTLQIHLARHSGIKPFHCTLCPAQFSQKGNLRVHVQKTHIAPAPGEKIYKCTMCTCIFKKVSSLNAHISRVHAGEKQCDDISDILEQLKQMEKQLQPKTPETNLPVVAKPTAPEVETEAFKYVRLVDSSIEGTLRRYMVKQRKVGDYLWYVCSFCTKEFKKPSDLIRHIRVHTREKPFKCKQCDQSFSLKSTLTTHGTTHIGKRQYQCALCLKWFTSVRTMNAHVRRHEKRSQQYMCGTCNTVFISVAKAKMHMELHNKADPINKALNKLGGIQVIMQQPMVETPNGLLSVAAPKSQTNEADLSKTRPHKCHYCSAAFAKKVHLKRHMLIHSAERKFKCNICTKSFYSSYALKEHLKFHSGERNFTCKICGKQFVTNAILKRHLTIHSLHRPYVCPYCLKRFKTIMLCRKHINIHKRDLNIKIHSLNETGELQSIADADTPPTMDLNDTLSDFSTTLPDATCNLGLSLENLSNTTEMTKEISLSEATSLLSKQKIDNVKLTQPNKDVISKILYTDENGIIITADLENQPQDLDMLQSSLSQHLYQTSIIPPNYDRATNLALLSETTTPADLGSVEDTIATLTQESLPDDSGFPTVLINCDDLQTFTTASLYNACLAQLKNNDPLLMSGINEIQDPNVLFSADPTLNQIADSQLDSQAFEMLMPAFTFSTNLAMNNLAFSTNSLNTTFPNIILSNVEDVNDINPSPVLPSINEISKKNEISLNTFETVTNSNGKLPEGGSEVENIEVEPSNMALSDDAITQQNVMLSNLLYNTGQLDVGSSTSDTCRVGYEDKDGADPAAELQNLLQKVDFACPYCEQILKNMDDVKDHNCAAKVKANLKKSTEQETVGEEKSIPTNNLAKGDSLLKSAAVVSEKPDNTCGRVLKSRRIIKPKQYQDSIVEKVSRGKSGKNRSKSSGHKCNYCDKVLVKKNALARHLLVHKDKKGLSSNTCSYCGKFFKKHSDLERHLRTHTGEKPFGCDKCDKSFSLKSTLESHYRTHNPGGNKEFNCAICSTYFSSKSSLRVHMLMHTGIKPYQCALCPETFRTSGNRKSHMGNHLKRADKKQTQAKSIKLNLLASVVMDPQETLQTVEESDALLNSIQQTTVQDKEDPQLQLVQEADKDGLYTNQTIQVDPLFLQQLQLNNVLLQDGADELSFVQLNINNDGQITQTATDINNFDETIYEEAVMPRKDAPITKDFECSVCYKKYSSRSVLTKHKKLHYNVLNTFKCTKCSAKFSSGEDLDNHNKVHLGYRPFCCQLCANTFSLEKNLKTHMKRIHGITLQS